MLWPYKRSLTRARNSLFHLMRQCTRKQKIRIWESEHIRLALAFVLEIYPDRLKITQGTLGAMLKVALGGAAVFVVGAAGDTRVPLPGFVSQHTPGSPGSRRRSRRLLRTNAAVPRQTGRAQHFLDGPVFLLKTSPL